MRKSTLVTFSRRLVAIFLAALFLWVALPSGQRGGTAAAAGGGGYTIKERSESSYNTNLFGSAPFGIRLADGFSRNGGRTASRWSGGPFPVYRDSVLIAAAAYCVSQRTNIDNTKKYTEIDLDTLQQALDLQPLNVAALRWVVNHGFIGLPGGLHSDKASDYITLDADDVEPYFEARGVLYSDLTAREALAGTQGAVWHFTDGVNIDVDKYTINVSDVNDSIRTLAFYEVLVALAVERSGEVANPVTLNVTLEQDGVAFAENGGYKTHGPYSVNAEVDGTIDSILITLSTDVPEVKFTSDAAGLDEITGIGAASGSFYLKIPSGVTGKVNITVSAAAGVTLNYNEPVIFVYCDENGVQDWTTSQAVIASVPAGTLLTSYAAGAATVPEDVVEGYPELNIHKTWLGDEDEYLAPGDWAVFKIEIENKGYGPAFNVAIIDFMDSYEDYCDAVEFAGDEGFTAIIPHTVVPGGFRVEVGDVDIGSVFIFVRVQLKEELDFGEAEELTIINVVVIEDTEITDEDSAKIEKPIEEDPDPEPEPDPDPDPGQPPVTDGGNTYRPTPAPAAVEPEAEPVTVDDVYIELPEEEVPLAEFDEAVDEAEVVIPDPETPLGELPAEIEMPGTGITGNPVLWLTVFLASLIVCGVLYWFIEINKKKSGKNEK